MTLKGYKQELKRAIRKELNARNEWQKPYPVLYGHFLNSTDIVSVKTVAGQDAEAAAKKALTPALMEPDAWQKYLRHRDVDISDTRKGWQFVDTELRKGMLDECLSDVLTKGKHYNNTRKEKTAK